MKTKILVGILFCSLMGCANKTQKSNVMSESDSANNVISFVENTVVDQSAGWQIIESMFNVGTTSCRDILMMTEFLTDSQQEVKKTVRYTASVIF